MNYTTVTVTKEYLGTVQRITGLAPGEAAERWLREVYRPTLLTSSDKVGKS